MKTTYFFPVITALLIVLFYLGLPDLKRIPLPHSPDRRPDRRDALLVTLLTLIYAAVAFGNLGDTQAPQTVRSLDGESAVIDLGGEESVSRVQFTPASARAAIPLHFPRTGRPGFPRPALSRATPPC